MVDTNPHRSRGSGAARTLGFLALILLALAVWWWWPNGQVPPTVETDVPDPAEVAEPVDEPGDASRTGETVRLDLVVGPDAVGFEGAATEGAVRVSSVAAEGAWWIGPEEARILAVMDPRSDADVPAIEAGATIDVDRGTVFVPGRLGELEGLLSPEVLELVNEATAVVLMQPELVDVL